MLRRLLTGALLVVAAWSVAAAQASDAEPVKGLTDAGVRAYREGRYAEAQRLFERALALDPENMNLPVFVARALHLQFRPGVETPQNRALAEAAVEAYKRVLGDWRMDEKARDDSFKAVAYIYRQLRDEGREQAWLLARAEDPWAAPARRSDAFVILASKKWRCSHDITEAKPNKRVMEDHGAVVIFYVKPKPKALFDKARACTADGLALVEQALALDPWSADAWAYKTHLLRERAKLAEMGGDPASKAEYVRRAAEAEAELLRLREEQSRGREPLDIERPEFPPPPGPRPTPAPTPALPQTPRPTAGGVPDAKARLIPAAFAPADASTPATRARETRLFGFSCDPDATKAPEPTPEARREMEAKLAAARAAYERRPADADAVIWLGRRTAYLGRFREAIDIYTAGIRRHPRDARLRRHRGHRYITARCFELAVKDLERAARLVRGRPDEVEPDGLPNARNVPTSTLKSNVYYHLGLAHYLRGDFGRARAAFEECMKFSKNDDMLAATSHWLYMTLRRLNRPREAAAVLARIRPGMDIIENDDYHRLLLMYKGETTAAKLLEEASRRPDSLGYATVGYAVGNWYLYGGEPRRALQIFLRVLEGPQRTSFGYVAAEAEIDRSRLRGLTRTKNLPVRTIH
ncbi:MAG TPA: tetratricopeptide repeat protein [Pyrinomonadaceae bacterium]|nr:tetratricopeptide repeat protein [Pyrinomonadaceae bacterium]